MNKPVYGRINLRSIWDVWGVVVTQHLIYFIVIAAYLVIFRPDPYHIAPSDNTIINGLLLAVGFSISFAIALYFSAREVKDRKKIAIKFALFYLVYGLLISNLHQPYIYQAFLIWYLVGPLLAAIAFTITLVLPLTKTEAAKTSLLKRDGFGGVLAGTVLLVLLFLAAVNAYISLPSPQAVALEYQGKTTRFGKDGDHIYYLSNLNFWGYETDTENWRVAPDIHYATFELIGNTFSVSDGYVEYAKDGFFVYFLREDKVSVVTNAHPPTFRLISGQTTYDAEDKNHKYLQGEIVE